MKVTQVFVRKIEKGKLFAKADVMFDDVMSVKGFTVFKNDDGGFSVLLPSTLGKSKDKETGELVDKWWPTIWIKNDTDEGNALLSEITEQVTLKIRRLEHGETKTNNILSQTEEDLLGDDDSIF